MKLHGRHTLATALERLLQSVGVRVACASLIAGGGWMAASALAASQGSSAALVVTKGQAVKQVASDGRHLVWATGPLEGDAGVTRLLERGLPGSRTRVLSRTANPTYGLAVTRGWVVYAEGGIPTSLQAVRLDGSKKAELSHSIVAPFTARGRLLAWLEQRGNRQRVVVRDMSTGRRLVDFSLPRCDHGRCYQLEAVALAADGVVFTRDSSGPDFSWVYRIRFSNRRLTRKAVPRDPQPNLAPSSAGAVYYVLGRGWYRWDFGRSQRRTRFRANPPAPVLGYESGHWLLSTKHGCDTGIVSLAQDGHPRIVVSPARLRRLVPAKSDLCVVLEAISWGAARPFTAWALIPKDSSEEHSDRGLYGVVFAGKPLP